MLRAIVTRLLLAAVTVFVVSVFVFLLVHANPTTPGTVAIGIGGTEEQARAYDEENGWHDPLPVQYWRWASAAATGDFGASLTDQRDVMAQMVTRLPVTASLAVGATLLSAVLGVLLGVLSAVHRRFGDKVIGAYAGVAVALPSFWLGILLVYLFAVQLSVLPATGYVAFESSPGRWLASLALPVLTLGLGGAAFVARQARASMVEALAQEHIRTLRATGTPRWRILYVHALRFASLPIVASIAMQFIAIFGGSVIIEQLFAMPGLGVAMQGAVNASDATTVQAIVVISTLVVVAVNLALELVSSFLDPKLRAT